MNKKKNSTKKRILLLVETSRGFGRRVIEGIMRFALEKDNWMVFLEDRGLLGKEPYWLRKMECNGIIARTATPQTTRIFNELSIPVVELLGDGKTSKAEVYSDTNLLGQMAAEHFWERGLRQFAFFSIGYAWWVSEVAEAFRLALADKESSCEVKSFFRHANSLSLAMVFESQAERLVIRWLKSLPKPIGILCPTDAQAALLSNICHLVGISVPNEIAILGIDNDTTLCNATSSPISSIDNNGHQIGYEAAILLLEKMEMRSLPPLPIKIPPLSLVTRRSTDFLAINDPDIAQAAQFIRDHALTRIQVDDVAKNAVLSRRTLTRKFREYLGHTPEQEILRVRMEHAQKLLRSTNLPIREIGIYVGYPSVKYFIKAFCHRFGLTPKQYRQKFERFD